MNALRATLTRTYRGEPLATVDGLPGDGADLTPEKLRALAAALVQIAADCESRPAPGKHTFRTVSRDYSLT